MQTGGGVVAEGRGLGGERSIYVGDRDGECGEVQVGDPVMATKVEGWCVVGMYDGEGRGRETVPVARMRQRMERL